MGYPVAADIVSRLAQAGIVATVADVSDHLATAIDEWERGTNCRPFLASGAATTRRFTPDRAGTRVLDLGTGAVEIVSVVVDGQTLTADQGYFAGPENAPDNGEPFTVIEFNGYVFGPPRSIVVSARWGYAADNAMPPAARGAVMGRAALLAAEPLMQKALAAAAESGAGAVTRVKEGDVEREFATSVTERRALFEQWEKQWAAALRQFRIVSIV